jgi:hypothetical protein
VREHHHISASAIVRNLVSIVLGDDEDVPLPLLMRWIKQELGTRSRHGKGMRTTMTMAANYQMMTMMMKLTGLVP